MWHFGSGELAGKGTVGRKLLEWRIVGLERLCARYFQSRCFVPQLYRRYCQKRLTEEGGWKGIQSGTFND